MRRLLFWSPLVLLSLLACVTVNVYFPEAAIKELSLQIEEEIRRQAAQETEAAPVAPAAEPESEAISFRSPLGFFSSPALAQDAVAAPEVTNPAIRKIIASRAERLAEVNRFKSLGVLGENNRALLEIRSLDPLSDLKERALAQRLVKEENSDRSQLFEEIANAKGVDQSQIPKIQETYAETLRKEARKGDWIQQPDGSWAQK